MICPNCNTQNDDSSMFCIHCGATLTSDRGIADQGAQANGSLGFAEGASKVLGNVGIGVLRNPSRFHAFLSDECDPHTREYLVFERNCVPALLEPFANAASPGNSDGLSRAMWMAEQYLCEQRAEDATVSHDVAVGLANAVASCSGIPIGNLASTGTVRVGAQSAVGNSVSNTGNIPNTGNVPNTATGSSTLTSPSPYAAQTPTQSTKRSPVAFIVAGIILIALIGGAVAFFTLRVEPPSSSSSTTEAKMLLSFNDGGAGSGSMDSITAEDGSSVVLPKCTYKRDGYEFVAWVDDIGNEYEPGDSYTPSKSTTLTAKWSSTKEDQEENASANSSDSANTNNSTSSPAPKNNTSTTQQASPAASFSRLWSGTYIGTSSYVGGDHHISRAVAFDFTTVTDSGHLEGVCYVGSDDTGAGETYGTCYVAGDVDWNTGEIHIQGTGWIDQGGLGDLREYSGSVDFSSQTMGGTAWDVGTGLYETPWDVHAVSEINIWQNGSLTTVQ